MESVEAEGTSIDEAIDGALKRLGVTRDRVEIEILGNATRGLFGIGGRKARVRATVRTPIDTELGVERPRSQERPAFAPAAPRLLEPVAVDQRLAERAQQVLQEIVDRIGVQAGVVVGEDDGRIVLELTGDATGVLIGRRGQMLDALEYMVNRIVSHDEGGATHILVDSQNYRTRRREALEDLARRMGEQAKKKRKPVSMNPMSPRDRRIVHLVLQGDTALATKSSGKGYYRRLIIVPAGMGKGTRNDG